MAHLVDGVVSTPVLVMGTVLAVAGLARGLKTIDPDQLPRVGLVSAAFFVASLVHVPAAVSSVHLLMSGLAGLILGWAAVPAIFVALVLQAVFFGFGGLTVLGVNTVILALPAVLVFHLFGPAVQGRNAHLWAAGAGAFAVLMTCALVALALAGSGNAFVPAAKLVAVTHVPVMVVEAVITAVVIGFLKKVKPDALRPVALAR